MLPHPHCTSRDGTARHQQGGQRSTLRKWTPAEAQRRPFEGPRPRLRTGRAPGPTRARRTSRREIDRNSGSHAPSAASAASLSSAADSTCSTCSRRVLLELNCLAGAATTAPTYTVQRINRLLLPLLPDDVSSSLL